MPKMKIDDSGISILLNNISNNTVRKVLRMYYVMNFSQEQITFDMMINKLQTQRYIDIINSKAKSFLNIIQCAECGRKFYSGKNSLVCPDCKKSKLSEKSDNESNVYRNVRSGKKSKTRYCKNSKSLTEIISEIERYNKRHNTHLSYGKYIEMVEKK
jgi:Zn finger protein HypA/HybF involved in hydrogenase expression